MQTYYYANILAFFSIFNKPIVHTPTSPLEERSCSSGSTISFEPIPIFVTVPRITASQTRNKARGIAVPTTIAVLYITNWHKLKERRIHRQFTSIRVL